MAGGTWRSGAVCEPRQATSTRPRVQRRHGAATIEMERFHIVSHRMGHQCPQADQLSRRRLRITA